jgi:hypothetical protein
MNITKETLYELYIVKRKTMQEIADKLGRCRAGIFKLLKKYNINTRKRGSHVPWNKDTHIYTGGGVKIGNIPWNKGLTLESDNRVAMNEKHRHKNRKYTSGYSWGHHTTEAKSKLSLSHGGTGIPYENTEYGSEFDSSLKEQIRLRDKYQCRECGCSQVENGKQLDVHHIDYHKKNCVMTNLISLCMSCHRKTNSNRAFWKEHFQVVMSPNVLIS